MKTLITLGKDLLNRFGKSGVVYKLICKKCKVTCVGQTGRLLNTRVEHKRILGESVIIITFCLIIERNMLIINLIGIMLRFSTLKVVREKGNL